jgi:CubicO group peptidase (beta-lactamase class C family)
MTAEHFLQCASLSKTVAAAFAIEYFANRGISMTESVNRLLEQANTEWRISTKPGSHLPSSAADQVNLAMLVNHTALGMHYVFGIPIDTYIPSPKELLDGTQEKKHKYSYLYLERAPGQSFSYSGGGFVVLQYLIEEIEGTTIDNVTRSFLDRVGLKDFTFSQLNGPLHAMYVTGHITREKEVNPALVFPPFAAGGLCTPTALATFLRNLGRAYHDPQGYGGIQHATARLMLGDETLLDLGALDFMGAKVKVNIIIAVLIIS